jgi:hypothetical protein
MMSEKEWQLLVEQLRREEEQRARVGGVGSGFGSGSRVSGTYGVNTVAASQR